MLGQELCAALLLTRPLHVVGNDDAALGHAQDVLAKSEKGPHRTMDLRMR